jgi:transposase
MTDTEQRAVEVGLRSSAAFTLRRCQILRHSMRGLNAREIAAHLGCDDQTVREAIADFNVKGTAALTKGSTRPLHTRPTFDAERSARVQEIIRQSPRSFGKPTSRWTLQLVVEVCVNEGVIPTPVSTETIRQALKRLGIQWKRAKRWIVSPDPDYTRKKSAETG